MAISTSCYDGCPATWFVRLGLAMPALGAWCLLRSVCYIASSHAEIKAVFCQTGTEEWIETFPVFFLMFVL